MHVQYPALTTEVLRDTLSSSRERGGSDNLEFGVITYGLEANDIAIVNAYLQASSDLKVCVHYCPLVEDATIFLPKNLNGHFVPLSIALIRSRYPSSDILDRQALSSILLPRKRSFMRHCFL